MGDGGSVDGTIAIVGMACRVPGAVNAEGFWKIMMEGTGPTVADDPRGRGGRLDGVDLFDAEFFGISVREARGIDPQQRLLLEVAHEAMQDAGQPAAPLAGSSTGVFVAQHTGDYAQMQRDAGRGGDMHAVMGAARGVTSGRISFAFDLRGPSVTIDTACSSSLVAVHMALQSMRAGDCGLALVGGVNVVLLPTLHDAFYAAGILAADGCCKFGDAAADGFVRSDGVAAVLLKPLSDAIADGDRVHALVLGSAVNNDGRSSGFLATPAVEGQEDMLRAAFQNAGVDAAEIDYVEAHGTGTPVGDSVELTALSRVLATGRPADRPCLLGSAKTTVGHTESAAGLIGMIRAALCLERAVVPPNPHLGELNAELAGVGAGVLLPREATPLPDRGRPSVAGVSSFGLSATNAHVVLAEPPPGSGARSDDDGAPPGRTVLLVGSARTSDALSQVTAAYRDHLAPGGPGRAQSLVEIGDATARRRDHHEHRFAVLARSHDDAVARLDDLRAGRPGSSALLGHRSPAHRPEVAFVFSGQGSQWCGMGRELLAEEPAFAKALLRCDEAVRVETGWSVLEHLVSASADRCGTFDVVQPVLWAVQVALAETWMSWGVRADVVIGHSMGEAAAAYVAGALTLADSAAVICRRSRLAGPLRGQGAMLLTGLTENDAFTVVADHEDAVSVAACNGPTSTVLSGDPAALRAIADRLEGNDLFTRWINVDIASHSPRVDAVSRELITALNDINPRTGNIPIHSTVLDEVVDGSGMDAGYWAANMREPVRFAAAVRGRLDTANTTFVEVSPHPVLTTAIGHSIDASGARGTALGTLRRGEPERAAMLTSLARMYVSGVPLIGAGGTGTCHHVELPKYPWQRASYWLDETPPPCRTPAAEPGRRTPGPVANGWASSLRELRPWRPDDELSTARPPDGVAHAGPGQVGIRVSHLGLGRVGIATVDVPSPGRYPVQDCVGVVEAVGAGVGHVGVGDEIVAIAPATLSARVVISALLVARKPSRLSAAEAATLPTAAVTALRSLVDLARIRVGDHVLIHSATGEVGLAALQTALWQGAKVLATAGSPVHRALLPMLGACRAVDPGSPQLGEELRAATEGRGVDVILGSPDHAMTSADLELLTPHGRYLHLGRPTASGHVRVGPGGLASNMSFSSIDIAQMSRESPEHLGELLRRAVELMESGVLRPLPRHDFTVAETAEAVRLAAQDSHVGRIVLEFATDGAPSAVLSVPPAALVPVPLARTSLDMSHAAPGTSPPRPRAPDTAATGAVAASVEDVIRQHAAAVVAMSADHLSADRPLNQIGMDSLMGAELRTRIHRSVGVRLPVRLILGGATVAELAVEVRGERETVPTRPDLGRALTAG